MTSSNCPETGSGPGLKKASLRIRALRLLYIHKGKACVEGEADRRQGPEMGGWYQETLWIRRKNCGTNQVEQSEEGRQSKRRIIDVLSESTVRKGRSLVYPHN